MGAVQLRVVVDGEDVSARLGGRLQRVTITDEIGYRTDEATLVVVGESVALPTSGLTMRIYMGVGDEPAADMGEYTVASRKPRQGPAGWSLTITARAVPPASVRTQRTRTLGRMTLAELAAEVAGRSGLVAKVSTVLEAAELGHVVQAGESDLSLVTRLATAFGGVAKIVDGSLVIVPAAGGQRSSGETLPVLDVPPGGDASADLDDRWDAQAVTARWYDADAAVERAVTEGEGEALVLPRVYASEDLAAAAARARRAETARGKGALEITITGDPRFGAGGRIRLPSPAYREGIAGTWRVTRVIHEVSEAGYTCRISGDDWEP